MFAGDLAFLGSLIVENVFRELVSLHGMSSATQVYLAGTRYAYSAYIYNYMYSLSFPQTLLHVTFLHQRWRHWSPAQPRPHVSTDGGSRTTSRAARDCRLRLVPGQRTVPKNQLHQRPDLLAHRERAARYSVRPYTITKYCMFTCILTADSFCLSYWNSTLPTSCVDARPSESWRCYFGYHIYATLLSK